MQARLQRMQSDLTQAYETAAHTLNDVEYLYEKLSDEEKQQELIESNALQQLLRSQSAGELVSGEICLGALPPVSFTRAIDSDGNVSWRALWHDRVESGQMADDYTELGRPELVATLDLGLPELHHVQLVRVVVRESDPEVTLGANDRIHERKDSFGNRIRYVKELSTVPTWRSYLGGGGAGSS